MQERLLEVKNLKTFFYTEDGVVPAVNDVSFSINKGETLGIVGESGCGKSITSLSVLRLIPSPPGKIIDGQILFKGENLLTKTEAEIRKIRGNDIAMIFQEPMTSLNPVFTVGQQIMEAIQFHQKVSYKEARLKAIAMLKTVKIPIPEKRIDEYPHQLSGGMRQRVMIAMALSCNPELLICDEPTTALDVTIQAQILNLIMELKNNLQASIMLITHDLGVISEIADNVMVMYAGKVIEYGATRDVLKTPLHPYTTGLIKSIPRIDCEQEELSVIRGMVPGYDNMPTGCLFNPRCDFAKEICRISMPELTKQEGHEVRCWKYTEQWEKVE